jgi:radical SAM superfamily enzyme YgiQ (UPF0313 family)
MRILLIDPVTTARTCAVDRRVNLRRGIGYPGIGLATVAALTPPGIHVRLIDESVEEIDLDSRYDLVGIAVQAPTAPYAYELAAGFRAHGTPVVLGGIHVSLNPEEALPHADALVIGEAELTWPGLLEDFARGRIEKIYRAPSLADLDRSPVPRRDLLRTRCYRIANVVQSSKGCPYGCEFCSLNAYVGHPVRLRSVPRVLDEIRSLEGDQFLFADDNLYADREHAAALLHALPPLGKKWVAETTWHIAFDEEVLRLARRGGCVGLFVGFDSINRQTKIAKIPAAGDIQATYIHAIQNIRRHGIPVVAAFVFGLDNDDTTVFERSLHVVQKGGADLVNFSALVPYPGTPVFNRLKREGRITDWDWSHYISPNVCFRPNRMTAAELNMGVTWAQREFYATGHLLYRALRAFHRFGWAMGLLTVGLNVAQKRNWGKGSSVSHQEGTSP